MKAWNGGEYQQEVRADGLKSSGQAWIDGGRLGASHGGRLSGSGCSWTAIGQYSGGQECGKRLNRSMDENRWNPCYRMKRGGYE